MDGTENNPIQWLEAIDGSASAEIDIGDGTGVTRSASNTLGCIHRVWLCCRPSGVNSQRHQQKSFTSIVTTSGQCQLVKVFTDPITLSATVSSKNSQLTADHFEWRSAFGSAIGSGDLEKGMQIQY